MLARSQYNEFFSLLIGGLFFGGARAMFGAGYAGARLVAREAPNAAGVAQVVLQYARTGSTYATACVLVATPYSCRFDTTKIADGSYSFDAGHAAYQGLAVGQSQDVVVSYEVTDENGGVWKLGRPTNSGSSQVYASSVLGSRPRDYFRFNDPGGTVNPVNQVTGHPATYHNVTFTPGAAGAGPFPDAHGADDRPRLPAVRKGRRGARPVRALARAAQGVRLDDPRDADAGDHLLGTDADTALQRWLRRHHGPAAPHVLRRDVPRVLA